MDIEKHVSDTGDKEVALPVRIRLGQALLEQGYISKDQLDIAVLEQDKRRKEEGIRTKRLGDILVDLGFTSEKNVTEVENRITKKEESLDKIDLKQIVIDEEALRIIPRHDAIRYRLFPLSYDAKNSVLTVAAESLTVKQKRIRTRFGQNVTIRHLLATRSDISAAIDQYYGHVLSIDGLLKEIETGEIDFETLLTQEEYSQPVVRLVDALLVDAVKREVSDIHFEPEAGFLRIRYRIDGALRQIRSLHKSYWPAIAVRIKVMSGMDIAEMRAPQDGHITLNVSGRSIDFRVAVQPTIHGENIVLRILDRQKGITPIDQIGLDDQQYKLLMRMLSRPEGIVLVTGPTGGGKTTTLYSILNHLNQESVNIMTLEDPVEYPMAQIRQTSVAQAVKLDFANGIRSMMRQDPDIILIGEIRDEPTAVMAFRAAMTGHQVFSTLHTNSALGVISRLLDIGIVPDILSGNIIGTISQRLVRVLCSECKRSVQVGDHEHQIFSSIGLDSPDVYYAAELGGCQACDKQGYRGRRVVMELLVITEEFDEMIVRRASFKTMKDYAESTGFQSLMKDAIKLVAKGVTSFEEISRVVGFQRNY